MSMTKKTVPLNTVDGCCKCLFTRYGRLGWENFLGRIIGGGWDVQMTSIMEIYEQRSSLQDSGEGYSDESESGLLSP